MADEFQSGVTCGGSWWSSMRYAGLDGPPDSCSTAVGDDLGGVFGWSSAGHEMVDGNAGSIDNSPASCITFHESQILQPSDHMARASAMDSSPQLSVSGLSSPSVDHWSQSFMAESSEPYSLKDKSHGVFNIDPSYSELAMNNIQLFSPSGFPFLDSFLGADAEPHQQESSGELPRASWQAEFPEILKTSPSMQQRDFLSNNSTFDNGSSTFCSLIRPMQLVKTGFEEKPDFSKPTAKFNSETATSSSYSSVVKKPRIETPSPLQTFKVRKEKLGDRITALQQLVSPFGKTDTASVLYEAIEYIKFLHEQVRTLSSPYFRNGNRLYPQQDMKITKDHVESRKQELRTRGLCLVPISSTFAVACSEIPPINFWTPAFGVSYI